MIDLGGGYHVSDSVWHILPPRWRERGADFAPILCSETEGITLPGYPVTRYPTCPDCIAISSSRASVSPSQEKPE